MSQLDAADPRPGSISLRGVCKRYGDAVILKPLDLEIAAGAFTVVLGPSGCGKSTLLRLIAGLEDLSAGSIAIGGRRVDGLAPKERGCAMVFQNYALYPHMSVADNLGYGLKLAKLAVSERHARVREVARLLGIEDLLERRPHQLSGGQRQRVAIGRAIARRPRVLLFDEPLSNLDAKLRHEMRIELRRLHDEIGATSIFVTHDQTEAMALADEMIVMRGGRIKQVAPPGVIYRQPASRFVAEFVGTPAMNLLQATVRDNKLCLKGGPCLPGITTLTDGTEILVGIRPEDLAIQPPHAAREGLPVIIRSIQNIGNHVIVDCLADGQPVIATRRSADDLMPGARIVLEPDIERVVLFSATTGGRLEHSVA